MRIIQTILALTLTLALAFTPAASADPSYLDGDSDDALDEDADFTFEDFDILTPFTKF